MSFQIYPSTIAWIKSFAQNASLRLYAGEYVKFETPSFISTIDSDQKAQNVVRRVFGVIVDLDKCPNQVFVFDDMAKRDLYIQNNLRGLSDMTSEI